MCWSSGVVRHRRGYPIGRAMQQRHAQAGLHQVFLGIFRVWTNYRSRKDGYQLESDQPDWMLSSFPESALAQGLSHEAYEPSGFSL